MQYDRSEIKVGLLLVAGVVLLVAFFAVINRWAVGERRRATAVFATVKGLKKEASVQYAGRRAGWVEDLRYVQVPAPEPGRSVTRVELLLAIDAEVPLTDRDVAYIDRSLTGEVVVEIQPRPGTPLEPDQEATLASKEVPTFASLMEKADRTVTDISAFAKEQRPVVAEALTNFRDTFGRARAAAGQLESLLAEDGGELHQAIVEAAEFAASARTLLEENRQPLSEAVANARDFFARLQALSAELEPELTSSARALREVSARLETFFQEQGPAISQTVTNLHQLSQDLSGLLAENRTRIGAGLEDLRRTAATVRVTVEDLRRNPWKLVLRPLGEDAYTQNLYDTARELVLSAAELARTAEQLERLRGEVPSADTQARLAEALESVRAALERSAALQQELWETLRARRR